MEISTISNECGEQNFTNLINAGIVNVKTSEAVTDIDTMANAKQFLDNTFPLAKGSHKEVCSYVVYYQQLLMFFSDGSHTGLKDSGQFVALNGHKSEPEAILLNNNGTHVELSFDRGGKTGNKDQAHIDDVRLEGHEYWISLLNVEEKRIIESSQTSQVFTAKDGSEYPLKG
ncbi:aldolase/citrate lyase/malate synthase family protein [Shewanella violacea]|uniref:Malate synthase domain protein n=1 Tax=Shewanella violacea (strain JCM 10179 / CIP 106290 / LMG 19151 / DSS12) TaxID=637905 RepID=D4ZMJ4_SHEVD|nr:malate synthase [Shewanella violacea]BAJ02893.1 malate synthase domain protein [Shewanella violacea DSS12]